MPKTRIKNKPYVLGIESTADDFSVGILSFDGKVLANIISAFMPEKGGIHPREAARHHAEVAGKVINEALEKADIRPRQIKAIAFSQEPGLGPCLRTGATAARALASYLHVPLVGVNHSVAHIEIGKLVTGALAYKHGITVPLEKSLVRLKWRPDEVHVPWVERG